MALSPVTMTMTPRKQENHACLLGLAVPGELLILPGNCVSETSGRCSKAATVSHNVITVTFQLATPSEQSLTGC